jgi:hypothetical protein
LQRDYHIGISRFDFDRVQVENHKTKKITKPIKIAIILFGLNFDRLHLWFVLVAGRTDDG